MKQTIRPRLPWIVAGLGLLFILASFLIALSLKDVAAVPEAWQPWNASSLSIPLALMLIVGGLIAARLPGNPYGWIWTVCGLGLSLSELAQSFLIHEIFVGGNHTSRIMAALLLASIGWVTTLALIPLLLLLFPTGRLPSPRWRVVAWAVAIAWTVALPAGWAVPGPSAFAPIDNPMGVQGPMGDLLRWLAYVAFATIFAGVPLAALSIALRYRRATGIERRQFKWLAYAAVVLVVSFAITSVLQLPPVWNNLASGLGLVALPLAVGIAMLRYRLYDIDLIIRRTLIYTVLTALLALVYLGVVIVSQELLRLLTGETSPLAIVISTLVIAAAFQPLRHRVQDGIDRRFYRRKYDAAKALTDFAATARDEVDLDALANELLRVVAETMQPKGVSVWLLDPKSAYPTSFTDAYQVRV